MSERGPAGRGVRLGPRLPRSHLVAGVFLLAALLYPVVNPWSPYTQGVALLMFLLAIQAVSWNIISGYAGYTSLGHSMFLGLGSYTVAIIALHTGVNPLWIAPLGGITAVVVAVAGRARRAAHPRARVRHHHDRAAAGAQILAVNLRG